jgi:hypothetical protein
MLIKVTGPDKDGDYTATMYDGITVEPIPLMYTLSIGADKLEAVSRCKKVYEARMYETTEWLSYDNEAA